MTSSSSATPPVSPSLLDSIIAAIQNKPLNSDGSLTLVPADFNNTFMSDWFTNVVLVQTITLASAQRALNNDVLTVTGNAQVWNVATPLTITLTFSADTDGNVSIMMSGAYAPANTVQLVIIPWLQMTNISINAEFLQPDEIVNFGYSCTLQAAGHPGIPVTVMKTGDTTWHIEIVEDATQPVTANDVVALLGGNTLQSFLPQLLINLLAGLDINGFSGIFDTSTNTVPSLQTAFTVTNGWNIAPGVSLQPGLQLSLTLINGNDPSSRQFAATVDGTFVLGGVNVPITMGANIGAVNTWTFGVQPGESVTLPSFSSLLQLAGNDFYNSLPAGLKDLPQIVISTLAVNFDTTNQVLDEITFAVNTASSWAVLPGYFEIYKLQVSFDITNVNVPAQRDVTGNVLGTFKFGSGLFLMCDIVKDDTNPNWTITAGLPPYQTVNFTQLVTGFFENKLCIPTNATQIVFNAINTSVTPSQGVFSLAAASTDTWTLFGNFAVNTFSLSITRSAAQGNPITGTIATQLMIGGVGINLSAALSNAPNSGWQFTGATQPGQTIAIGQLITYLTSTFGVSSPPAWISGITLQNLSINFNTSPSNTLYQFHVTGNIPLADHTFQVAISFDMQGSQATGFTKVLSGTVTVNNTAFQLTFSSSTTDTQFSANWSALNPQGYLQLSSLVSALGITLPLTDALDLSLKSITLIYDFTHKAFVMEASSASYSNAAFASYLDANNARQYYFGMNVSSPVNLSNLPLVNRILPSGETMQIEQLQAVISSVPVTDPAAISTLNTILGPGAPQVPDAGIPQQVQFSMNFAFGNTNVPVALGFGSNSGPQAASAANSLGDTPASAQNNSSGQTASDGSHWFNVQRSFGSLSVERVGLKYQSNIISVLFDASLAMGGLDVSVAGLSVGMNIQNFTPAFAISGLGIDYSNSTFELGGAFLKVDPPQSPATLEFAGGVVVKTSKFGVMAMGDYAAIPTGTSMFIFASVSYPFGGPPYFFITGFCGGFGYNSNLRLPAMDEVYQFPFVAGLTNPSQVGGAGASPLQVLQTITGQTGQPAWVTPEAGSMWAAIGIQFSTFSIINSTALLTAVFGNSFKLALIGLSKASFPMGASSPYAYVELELEALFDPGDGIISFTAVLSPNSYVIDPNCHLTGGFAMFFWYGNNTHAGDFVVTLGGYSHYFTPPSWYPQLQRLGFNWSLDSHISITGGSYFALTPSALMAGGALSAVYSCGNLNAWFTAHADIVIWWNPFHFIAEIGISVGASYKMNLLFTSVTMRAELGADLTLWGPPTGGTVTVHWWVISFTIDFGSDQSTGLDKQQWSDFNQVLPAPADAVKFSATRGLAPAQKQQQSQQLKAGRLGAAAPGDNQPQHWLVRSDKFQFATDATVPVTNLFIGKTTTVAVQNGNQLNIRPMQASSLNSSHRVYLMLADGVTEINMLDPQNSWSWTATTKNVPNALWGQGDNKQLSDGNNQLIGGQLTGMVFSAPAPATGYTPGIATLQNLGLDPLPPGTNPLKTGQAASGPVPAQSDTTIAQIAQVSQQATNRNGLASALQQLGITVSNDNPVKLGNTAGTLFSDEPMIINSPAPVSSLMGSMLKTSESVEEPETLLDYSFKLDPDPLEASPRNGDPNLAKISIAVSNGGTTEVNCKEIIISFSIGNLAQNLTSNEKSIHYSVLTSDEKRNPLWNISWIGNGQFKATPVKPADGKITTEGIVIEFYNIQVNKITGTTPVEITEITSAQTRRKTRALGKFPPEFTVKDFRTENNKNIIGIGDDVTLVWTGSKNATYTLSWQDSVSGEVQVKDVTVLRKYKVEDIIGDTTFYLTVIATVDGESATRTLNFPVTVKKVKIISFKPEFSVIHLGGKVKLTWETVNAHYCKLASSPDVELPANGEIFVVPKLNERIFTLTAHDKNKKTVTVSAPVNIDFHDGVINSFKAVPDKIYPAGTVALSWSVTSALSLIIDNGIGLVTGNSIPAKIYRDTLFILTCHEAKQGVISAKVNVPVVTIEQYLVGQAYSLSNRDVRDKLEFISADEANYSWEYGSKWGCRWGKEDYPCKWTLSGNNLQLKWSIRTFDFIFDPADNTLAIQNPPYATGFDKCSQSHNTFSERGETIRPDRKFRHSSSRMAKDGHHAMPELLADNPSPLLNYTFAITPDPVQVSPATGNPNTAKISIAVAAGDVHVNCSGITFSINVGDGAQDLTHDDSSIRWSVLTNGQQSNTQWSIARIGQGMFKATPVKPEYGTISTEGIVFVLYDINVNTEVGSTPLVITEVTNSQTAYCTQMIGKFPPGFVFENFRANPVVIAVGGSTTLTWSSSQNATYKLTWDTNSQNVTNVRTFTVTGITKPTTFYLEAKVQENNRTVSKLLSFPVSVLGVEVNTFTADRRVINLGDSVTLSWTTTNADHCLLVPPMGKGKLPANGSIGITPTLNTTTFNIEAFDINEFTHGSALPLTVSFNNGTINLFTVTPSLTYPGGTITLSWQTTSALFPSISSIGNVSGNSLAIQVPLTNTFVLTCHAVQGPITSAATVTVVPVAQYLVGCTYTLHNYVRQTYPSGAVVDEKNTYDTLVFTSATAATYSWAFQEDDYDAQETSTASQSYPGTWTLDGNIIRLTSGSNVFGFVFDPVNNQLTLQNPPDINGKRPGGMSFSASGAYVRPSLTFSLQSKNAMQLKSLSDLSAKEIIMLNVPPAVLLDYSQTSSPPSLTVSPSQGAPAMASITINVSNSSGIAVDCSSILFSFEVDDTAAGLTTDDSSIKWSVLDSSGNISTEWQITWLQQGQFKATPAKPEYGTFTTQGYSFVFFNIDVNQSIGTTPLIITETSSLQTASKTINIGKFQPGFIFENFKAGPNTVVIGNGTTLTWNEAGASLVLLQWGNQSVNVTNAQMYPIPASEMMSNTVFYLVATSIQNGQTVSQTLTFPVTVLPVEVNSFNATIVPLPQNPSPASSIQIDLGDSIQLSWTTENTDHCRLVPPIDTDKLLANGNIVITPTLYDTSINLYAYTQDESVSAQPVTPVTILFNDGVINSFTSDYPATYAGGPINLSWSITSAYSPSITPGIGDVTGNSIAINNISEQTTFVLSCLGKQGSITATVTIPIVPVETYLVGKQYSPQYMTAPVTVSFLSSTQANIWWGNYPWTISDNNILININGYNAAFTFDPATNTLITNYSEFTAIVLPGSNMLAANTSTQINWKKTLMRTMGQTLSVAAPVATQPSVLLSYTFSNSPDPLQVDSIASITVAVANTAGLPITCSSITFNFTVDDLADGITADDSSIVPIVTPEGEWEVSAQGQGVFIATPSKPDYAKIEGGGLLFEFSNINVNEKIGSTPLTIVEVTTNQTAQTTTLFQKVPVQFSMDNFVATPALVPVGTNTVLTWNSSPDATLNLSWKENSSGIDVSNSQAYTFKNLVRDETFVLTGKGTKDNETITQTLAFPVTMLPAKVDSFTLNGSANNPTINYGDSVTIGWTTECADHCRLTPAMNTSGLGSTGTVSVTPTQSQNQFYITAYDTNEVTSGASPTITVNFNNATINSFTASSTSVYIGDTITLSWSVTSAISVSISGIGTVTGNSVSVQVNQPTTFVLSCVGVQGTVTSSIPVNASPMPIQVKLMQHTYYFPSPYNENNDFYITYTLAFNTVTQAHYIRQVQPPYGGPQSFNVLGTWSIDGNNIITVNYQMTDIFGDPGESATDTLVYDPGSDSISVYVPPPPPGPIDNNPTDPFGGGGIDGGIDGGGSGLNIN